MKPNRWWAGLVAAALGACAAFPEAPFLRVEGWGTMREVLREGKVRGRVHLKEVAREGSWGVGVLEDLEGEVTIVDGAVSLAVVEEGVLLHRELTYKDEATLLVLARVDDWSESELPAVRGLEDLELVLEPRVREAGYDPLEAPVPVRVEGEFLELSLHVLDGSCPIANPDGPPPFRWSGAGARGTLVGFYAEGQGGILTHHGQQLHVHAVVESSEGLRVSGHVDSLQLGESARLFLPSATRGGVETTQLR